MLNPNNLTPGYVRINDRRTMIKFYKAAFTAHQLSLVSRRRWDIATEADKYAKAILARWKRLYDAAILELAK